MAEPKVSILLTMVDKLSGPAERAKESIGGIGGAAQSALARLKGFALGAGSIAAVSAAARRGFEAFDEFERSQIKLEGTAKITGIALETLQAIMSKGMMQFGLSQAMASDFAVEMAKLASAAGDVGLAGPLLQKFLDIGAARGMTAAETLKAVQQSILGIDEGTDKLFNANPSVLYKRFAESIGTTAGKLTDMEKSMALANAAMIDGGKVTGALGERMDTTAGKVEKTRIATEMFYARLGELLDPLRVVFTNIMQGLANIGIVTLGTMEVIGTSVVAVVESSWRIVQGIIGGAFEVLGAALTFAAKIAGPLKGELEFMGNAFSSWGDGIVTKSQNDLRTIGGAWKTRMAEIYGVAQGTEAAVTAEVKKGGSDRTKQADTDAKAREKVAAESAKNLLDLEKLHVKSQMELLSAQQREYEELVRSFREKMEGMTAADYRRAEELLKQTHLNMLMKWAGFNNELIPKIREPITQLKPIITEFGEAVAAAAPDQAAHEKWGRLKNSIAETGTAIGKGAEEILRFSRDIGVTNPQLEKLVGGIGRLAEGIGGIASGNIIGGIASGILGLQGIVGSLFGNSPAEQARKAMLERNTEALTRLRGSIGDLMNASLPGAKIAGFRGLDAGSVISGSLNTKVGDANYGKLSAAGLSAILAKRGLTLTDMRTLAKDLGIDLGEAGGFFDPARVNQFFQAINAAEFAQFDQSFGGQQDFLQTYFNVAGITDPGQQAAFAANNLKGENDFLANMIAGFDLDTAEGRSGLQQAFSGVLQNLNNGTFDVANFGNLTGSEFVQFIEFFTGLLQQMGSAGGAGGAPTFSGSAPTGAAPVTVTAEAAADLMGPITETATNTRRTADAMERLLGMVDAGALSPTIVSGGFGASMEQIDAALAAERDLREAAGVS